MSFTLAKFPEGLAEKKVVPLLDRAEPAKMVRLVQGIPASWLRARSVGFHLQPNRHGSRLTWNPARRSPQGILPKTASPQTKYVQGLHGLNSRASTGSICGYGMASTRKIETGISQLGSNATGCRPECLYPCFCFFCSFYFRLVFYFYALCIPATSAFTFGSAILLGTSSARTPEEQGLSVARKHGSLASLFVVGPLLDIICIFG